MKIKVENKEDREQLALILIRNGYVVSIEKEKEIGKSKLNYYVKYENKVREK